MHIHQSDHRNMKAIAVLSAVVLLAAACGDDDDDDADPAPAATVADADITENTEAETAETAAEEPAEMRNVTLAMSTCSPYYYGYQMAFELGLFEEEGLNVSGECTGGSADVGLILAAGSADIGAAGFSAVLPAMAQEQNIYPFFVHTYGEPYDMLVPAESEVMEVGDLAGLTIGVSELAGGEMPMVRGVIDAAGLDPDADVSYLEVGTNPATVAVAFDNGDIAAYASGVSDTATFPATGIAVRSILPEFVGNLAAGGLMASEAFKDETDVLIGISRAAAKGHLMALANPDGAVCVMKEAIPAEFEDPEAGRASMEGSMLATTPPKNDDGTYDFSAGINDVDAWTEYIGIYANAGVIEAAFDPAPLLIDIKDATNDFDQQEVIDRANALPTDC